MKFIRTNMPKTESLQHLKQVLDEKQKELSSFCFSFVPQKDKDSRIPVSTIQNYIAQKLNINDHTEVDVACCCEKLKGEMTLKDIQHTWMSHLPNSGRIKAKWDMKELVIELGDNEKIQSIAQKIQFLLTGKGQLGSEADDTKQGAGTSKPPGTNNQFEYQEISGEKFHHKPADAEKENTLDRMSSQESLAFPTAASAVKRIEQNAKIGKPVIEDNIKEHKKKKRSNNRRARHFTPGETSKTEDKKADIGPDDNHKDGDARDRASSAPESKFWMKNKRNFPLSGFLCTTAR
ncbi:hypothetical protein HAX54_006815 [Datura stramonium]|uniref:Uncharacterized protein n=1 Tax=Datura stramonium TaxID=4076 RepID=A0ABS8RVE1_DATST|nr:hypothetical protein [Datura stramonium]